MDTQTREVLCAILDELKEMRLLLASFTSEGMPLRAQTITPELAAASAAAAGLLARTDLTMAEGELDQRLQAAQVVGSHLTREHDRYVQAVRPGSLERLLGAGSGGAP